MFCYNSQIVYQHIFLSCLHWSDPSNYCCEHLYVQSKIFTYLITHTHTEDSFQQRQHQFHLHGFGGKVHVFLDPCFQGYGMQWSYHFCSTITATTSKFKMAAIFETSHLFVRRYNFMIISGWWWAQCSHLWSRWWYLWRVNPYNWRWYLWNKVNCWRYSSERRGLRQQDGQPPHSGREFY